MSAKRNEANKLWLDLEKRFSSTSVGAADESNLNKMRQMVLTAKKITRYADQMKETTSSSDEVLIKKQRKQILVHVVKNCLIKFFIVLRFQL